MTRQAFDPQGVAPANFRIAPQTLVSRLPRQVAPAALLALGLFLCLCGWMAYIVLTMQVSMPRMVEVNLHSVLIADYSADPRGQPLPAVQISLLEEAISEHGGTDAPGAVETLTAGLLTPVPTTTPLPGSTSIALPATPTPTALAATLAATATAISPVTSTPTGTQSATQALVTSTATMLPSSSPTATPTVSATFPAFPSPTGTQPPVTPVPTQTPAPTFHPTATNLPNPTSVNTPVSPSSTPASTVSAPTNTQPPPPTATPVLPTAPPTATPVPPTAPPAATPTKTVSPGPTPYP